MGYQDELQRTLRRLHDRTLSNSTVRVLEPSVSYEPGAGPTVTHEPVGEVSARLEVPNRTTSQDEGGIAEATDATIRVRDDEQTAADSTDGGFATAEYDGFTFSGTVPVRWTNYEGGATAHVVDTETGDRYEVRTKTREQNGLLRLAVELTDDGDT